MKRIRFVLLVSTILCFASLPLHGQELMYLKTGKVIDATIEDIGETHITYNNYSTGQSEKKVSRKKVIMLFRQGGSCIVFRQHQKEKVFWPSQEFDKLLTQRRELLPVSQIELGADFISYVPYGSIEKKQIPRSYGLAIFYRNNTHIFLVSPEVVANGLLASEGNAQPSPIASTRTHPPVSEHSLGTPEPLETDRSIPSSSPRIEPAPVQTAPPVSHPVEAPKVSKTVGFQVAPESDELPVDLEEFKQKAVRKTEQFTRYVGRIADRSTSKYEAVKAIGSAVTLFVNDTCIVEVSNVKSQEKQNFYIRKYLNRVRLYGYDRVQIEWAEINYVGNIRKGPDGNWYGTVTFQQIFTGFVDDRPVYKDVTQKRVEVKFKGYTKVIDGQSIDLWDVLLSNIAVEQTSI